MPEKKTMPPDVRKRCFDLRCQSKRGVRLHQDDSDFLEDCWRRYPEEYGSMSDAVFEATKPFGA